MQEAKHTPGPWEADSNGKIWGDIDNEALDGDSPLLAEMFGNGKEQRANARLFAAAPELLEALQGLIAHLGPNGYIPNAGSPATDKARHAIAKATASEGAV